MIGWLALVAKAHSPRELCEITRYFLASITPEEWATVPPQCWPKVKAVDDLRFWHDRLADEFCTAAVGTDPSRTHRELMTFFSAVIDRLVLVESPLEDAASNDQSAEAQGHAVAAEDISLPARKNP